ncbi:glycoside hydrolase family 15 protein [Nocardia stercoris]|uniref:glycoside hydrolase family 15 protein n=1 Tax=Nocardia stercoris TaxID=2483361 RepID=UPI001F3823D5|nr:glycoside hydrolase family 15 protein [Nocardia stercoris]
MNSDQVSGPTVLREYALLADGQRGALVGPRGEVAWLCAPGWDDESVFDILLGGSAEYLITPAGRFVWGGYYETGSLIWHSHWVCGDTVVECREALAFPGERNRVVLLRRILARHGSADVRVRLRPAAGFGTHPATRAHHGPDGWTARTGPLRLRWTGARAARWNSTRHEWTADVHVPANAHHDLVLELSPGALPDPVDPDTAWQATESAWQRESPALGYTAAPRDAAHAYAVLRGMTADTGGTVAAATTSIPELADQGENYDYRYVWIRDQCIAGQAVAADGAHPLLDSAVGFITERLLADGPDLAPAYTTAGTRIPRVRPIPLPGYPGGTPVTGNVVRDQFQLDIFGEALLLYAAAARRDRLAEHDRRAAAQAIAAIADRFDRPDAGIWELDDDLWTHSRLICVAGLRAVAACPATGADQAVCSGLADTILAETTRTGLHASGRWQRSPRYPGVDASLALPLLRGAVPVGDPRYAATVQAIHRELTTDLSVYRYRHDGRPLETVEGAFLLCGFAMAIAYQQLGRPVTAMRFFEANRAACGTPALFAEEFDVTQRQLRGNMPQAFVHALLFEAAVRLADCE